jgi:hypothetical protein
MDAAVKYVDTPEPEYGLHHLPHLGGAVLQILLPDEVKILREEPVTPWSGSDPQKGSQDSVADEGNERDLREKMLDKTIADSFPASDPPSTDPAPLADSFTA